MIVGQRTRIFLAFFVAIGSLLISDAPAIHAASTQRSWIRVLTHVTGNIMAGSQSPARLLEVGPSDIAQETSDFYAVIDTTRARVMTRAATGGSVSALAIDASRGIGYLIGSVTPPLSATQSSSPESALWTIDLRSGHLVGRYLFAEGGLGSIMSAAVDTRTGFLVIGIGQGASYSSPGWGAVVLLDPHTLWMRRAPLLAPPMWMAVESAAQRIVVAFSVPPSVNSGPPTTVIEGLDTTDGQVAWNCTYAYAPAGLTDNPRTSEIWVLAPGGLITRLSARQGNTTGLSTVALGANGPPRYVGLFMDALHDTGYIELDQSDNSCELDRLGIRPGARRITILHTGGNGNCGDMLGIAEPSGLIVVTLGGAVQVIDPGSTQTAGRVLGTTTDQVPDKGGRTLANRPGQPALAVYVTSVPDPNQETGSTTAVGLTLVPIV